MLVNMKRCGINNNSMERLADDDMTLVEKSQQGNIRAFEELVSRYTGLVGSIAYNIVGDMHMAADLTQETFIKVHRGLKELEEPRKFKGWLCSIVRTTCVDWLRKEKVRPASLDRLADDGIEPAGKFIGGAFKQTSTEEEELKERILNIVNTLPKIYQEIILLRHLRKFTYREMSDFLGLPIATIESRLYRARLMLKERLQDLYI
ncbi:MAG: hypothetical protein A2W23_03370 [Planctomycetes bacterium RBG_16_43_13]|nr:MAG: hypothetical protein A2W23_03370 [Planctomycetes bacterium RBG_16_43_13]